MNLIFQIKSENWNCGVGHLRGPESLPHPSIVKHSGPSECMGGNVHPRPRRYRRDNHSSLKFIHEAPKVVMGNPHIASAGRRYIPPLVSALGKRQSFVVES